MFLRDLESGTERAITGSPLAESYSALSPDGTHVAYGLVMPGTRVTRPVVVVNLATLAARRVCDDCGGRPRQWLDDRTLLIERFGPRLNSITRLDVATGTQRPLIESDRHSVSNPRVSIDGSWIAFDAALPGTLPGVFVARLEHAAPVGESAWIETARAASHPFWSADGRTLYFLRDVQGPFRRSVNARRFDPVSGQPEGEVFLAYRLGESLVPAWFAGTTPIATAKQMLFVLSSFRGDVWIMHLDDTEDPSKTL